MPTIVKLPKKEKSTYHSNTDMRELRRKAYNLSAWRKLREAHLKSHPVCAECERQGRVRPASQVHHIISPFRRGQIDYVKLLDPNNLESICPVCHGILHQKERGYKEPQKIIEEIDALLDGTEQMD